ncbi:MAG: alpha-glycosidase, partial [Clostridiales bacterium]
MEVNVSVDNLTKAQKLLLYLGTRQPVLNDRAVFSDGTSFYRQPSEPSENDQIKIRIRTRKDNVNFVYLRYDEKKEAMTKFMSNELFDFYEITLSPRKEILAYYFELHIGKLKVYYNKKGVIRENDPYYNFFIIPNYKTPDWAKGAVLYQIFVDRFYNGDKSNDVLTNEYKYIGANSEQVEDWYKYPNADGIREFYGGDLKGV